MKTTNTEIEEKLRSNIMGCFNLQELEKAVKTLNMFLGGQQRLKSNPLPTEDVSFPSHVETMTKVTLEATGDQGSGKSLLLNEIADLLNKSGHVTRLHPEDHTLLIKFHPTTK
jgi:ABC-type antimicrobial peptide transport system ATPase subunit